MKIIFTNISKPFAILKNGKEVQTGIYKKSVKGPVSYVFTDVLEIL
jgi:hypothetical protein